MNKRLTNGLLHVLTWYHDRGLQWYDLKQMIYINNDNDKNCGSYVFWEW